MPNCRFTVTAIPLKAGASARRPNHHYWANVPCTVTFYDENSSFTTAEKNSIIYAMGYWNAIRKANGGYLVAMKLSNTRPSLPYSEFHKVNNPYYKFGGWTEFHPDSPGALTWTAVYINTAYSYSVGNASPGKRDFQSLVEHELGHALGIAHCHEIDDYGNPIKRCESPTDAQNVMNPLVPYGTNRRTLTSYDIGSYRTIYN